MNYIREKAPRPWEGRQRFSPSFSRTSFIKMTWSPPLQPPLSVALGLFFSNQNDSRYYYLLPEIAVEAPPGSRERNANYYDELQIPQSLPKRSFSLNDIMDLKVMLRA
mgnify:CR=1 FL=1